MKETLVIACVLVIFVFFANLALASPFLVCDPQEGVVSYNVYMDGVLFVENVPAEADGSLRLDLEELKHLIPDGEHTFTATAENLWDESDMSDPFVFVKKLPGRSENLKLKKR